MGPLWTANIVLIAISVVIFGTIMISYLKSYRETKARLFSGIISFSSVLLMQSVLSLVIYYNLSLKFGSELAALLLIINSLSLIGYVLLYRLLSI